MTEEEELDEYIGQLDAMSAAYEELNEQRTVQNAVDSILEWETKLWVTRIFEKYIFYLKHDKLSWFEISQKQLNA